MPNNSRVCVEGDEDGDGISEHFVPTAGDAFIGGVDQAIAGVDSVVDEAFDLASSTCWGDNTLS